MRNIIFQQMETAEERLQSASIIMESGMIVDAVPVLFKAADIVIRILLSFKEIELKDFSQNIELFREQYGEEAWFDEEMTGVFHSLSERNESYWSKIEIGVDEREIKNLFDKMENFLDRTRKYLKSRSSESKKKTRSKRIKKITLACVSAAASAVLLFFLIKLFMSIFGPPHGLLAYYYNNIDLEGPPVVERIDKKIIFDWGASGPHPGVNSKFSVRWEGRIKIKKTERYIFIVHSDEGVRLYVDDASLIDTWFDEDRGLTNTGRIKLEEGFHRIRLEYYSDQQHADIILLWRSKTQKRRIVESSVLFPPSKEETSD